MHGIRRKSRVITADDVRNLLLVVFDRVYELGGMEIAIKAGKVHRRLGGYPGADHRMPLVCEVMRKMMGPHDEAIAQPPHGDGANLVIRYKLPKNPKYRSTLRTLRVPNRSKE
jgi:5-methylcytosine-specific restriction protein A